MLGIVVARSLAANFIEQGTCRQVGDQSLITGDWFPSGCVPQPVGYFKRNPDEIGAIKKTDCVTKSWIYSKILQIHKCGQQ